MPRARKTPVPAPAAPVSSADVWTVFGLTTEQEGHPHGLAVAAVVAGEHDDRDTANESLGMVRFTCHVVGAPTPGAAALMAQRRWVEFYSDSTLPPGSEIRMAVDTPAVPVKRDRPWWRPW